MNLHLLGFALKPWRRPLTPLLVQLYNTANVSSLWGRSPAPAWSSALNLHDASSSSGVGHWGRPWPVWPIIHQPSANRRQQRRPWFTYDADYDVKGSESTAPRSPLIITGYRGHTLRKLASTVCRTVTQGPTASTQTHPSTSTNCLWGPY